MESALNMSVVDLVILALAVYRITRLIIEDAVTERLREAVWSRFDASRGIGYLITCYWCTGFWVASLLVLLFIIVPVPTMAASLILALSALAGIIAARLDR
jgi:hypothetical protein